MNRPLWPLAREGGFLSFGHVGTFLVFQPFSGAFPLSAIFRRVQSSISAFSPWR